jgi:hypothetical protein
MLDRLKVLLQHLLPKQRLTVLAGRIAGAKAGATTTRLIRWFVGKYGVDMSEADNADIGSYESFNDFFTRPLRAGARPLADADFVCPVDGAISQFGAIDDHHISRPRATASPPASWSAATPRWRRTSATAASRTSISRPRIITGCTCPATASSRA